MVMFRRYCWTVFQNVWTNLYSPNPCISSSYSCLCPRLILWVLRIIAILLTYEYVDTWLGFNWHFSNKWFYHSFTCLLDIIYRFLLFTNNVVMKILYVFLVQLQTSTWSWLLTCSWTYVRSWSSVSSSPTVSLSTSDPKPLLFRCWFPLTSLSLILCVTMNTSLILASSLPSVKDELPLPCSFTVLPSPEESHLIHRILWGSSDKYKGKRRYYRRRVEYLREEK